MKNKTDYFLDDGDDERDDELDDGQRPVDRPAARPEPAGSTGGEPRPRRRGCVAWAVLVVGAALGMAAYLRYATPYVEDVTERVFIASVRREGLLFKTLEGEMVSVRPLAGDDRVYSRSMDFSVEDESLAEPLRRAQLSRQPVTVAYKRYYGALPWRGASTTVVTAVTAD